MQSWGRALSVLSVALLAGCSMFGEQPSLQYTQAVEQLGLTPVYPPREDIQVGDLYAVSAHSFAARNTAKTALIGRDDLTPQITEYLASRYKFADTAVGSGSSPSLSFQQIDARNRVAIPGRSDRLTLPIDGFPQIDYDTGVSVGVQGQPQNLAAVFGFEAAKTLHMSLLFGGVTSYEVPLPVGLDALDSYCSNVDPEMCQNQFLSNWLNQKFQLGKGDPGFVAAAGILMVTKVYLARQITFTFNDATLAAAAAASLPTSGTPPAAPTVSTTAINAAAASQDPANLQALATIQSELNASLARQGGPGGEASLSGFTRTGVSFSQVFARPVVVGYEGVSKVGQ